MNPAALAMTSLVTSNPTPQSNTKASDLTSKFGEALDRALSNNMEVSESDVPKPVLTTEQKKVMGDLLDFLQMDSLSELEDGNLLTEKVAMDENSGEGDALLQMLMKLNGEDQSAVAEFLTDILNLKVSVSEGNQQDVQNKKAAELTPFFTRIPFPFTTAAQAELKLEEGKTLAKVEAPITKEAVNQLLTNILTEVTTAQGELKSEEGKQESAKVEASITKEAVNQLLTNILTEVTTAQGELKPEEGKLEPAKVEASMTKEAVNLLLSEIPSVIYSTLRDLDSFDVKALAKIDLNGTANLLKLAKIQDFLLSQKDMTEAEGQMQNEIKNLLASMSDKLEKWLGSQPTKSGNEAIFGISPENGANKSLDVVKQVYVRVLNAEGETSDETVSNGLTLKTAETNTQSSLLPFQMTKLEQYVLTTSKNGQAVDAEQFIKSFENILSKANFSNKNGVQKLLIRLNPENLGSLRIELIQKDGAMVAKILATTSQAKELLDRQVQGLKQAFTNQNIQVEKVEISQQISTFNAERFAPRDQGQHEQRQQQIKQEIIEDEETDFTDRFEEALLNLKV